MDTYKTKKKRMVGTLTTIAGLQLAIIIVIIFSLLKLGDDSELQKNITIMPLSKLACTQLCVTYPV